MLCLFFSFGDGIALTTAVFPTFCFVVCFNVRRRLTREKIDELHAQLSIHTTPPASSSNKKSKKKGAVKGMAGSALTGEEVAAATLRLLASVARFHRRVSPPPPLSTLA